MTKLNHSTERKKHENDDDDETHLNFLNIIFRVKSIGVKRQQKK